MPIEKLKVALIAGSMPNFSSKGMELFRANQTGLKKMSKEQGFDLTVYTEPVMTEEKAMDMRKDLDSNAFDFILLFHPTYIIGDVVFELFKARAFFGLWAAEEPSRSGSLPLASLVCLNQNSSIASHYFRSAKRKIKWFFGDVNHKYFKPRLEITVRALTAIKNLRDAKVGQIGKIADGFRNMYYDERAIYATLGVDVVRGIEIEDVLAEADRIDNRLVDEEVKRIKAEVVDIRCNEEKITASVKNYLATKMLCEKHRFKAVAFSCWPKLGALNLTGCLTVSMLDSFGIPAGCEGDMLSTISSLILRYLSGKPTAVMDLPAFDDEENALLFWHCGAAPFEMANERGVVCRNHYRAAFADESSFDNLSPVTDIIYPESEITVFRLTGESDYYYYLTGRVLDRDIPSYDGSRGWVGELHMYGKAIGAVDFINTAVVQGIQHHYPIILKDVSPYIEEFAFWLDLKKVNICAYEDFAYQEQASISV